jgi:5-methylcytosine-specific restriction enzyme subunit McrC
MRLGLPKTYESRTERTARVSGRLDPLDYALNNKLALYRCTFREHSYDNEVSRLIAQTAKVLKSHSFFRDNDNFSQLFQVATQGKANSLSELLATEPIRNPSYADFNPVVAASKHILRNQYSSFGEVSQTNAFLFDISMLFESFIRKLLKRNGIIFLDKQIKQWEIPSGGLSGVARRRLIPDLVFELHEKTYVFDVKYKAFDFRHGVSREDLFQLHTYAGQISNDNILGGCGFIFPVRASRWHTLGLEGSYGTLSDEFAQGDRSIPFYVCFLRVPEQGDTLDDDWPSVFRAEFRGSCNLFAEKLLATLMRAGAAAAGSKRNPSNAS